MRTSTANRGYLTSVMDEQTAVFGPSNGDTESLFAPLGNAPEAPGRTGPRRWLWIGICVAFVLAVAASSAVAWTVLGSADFRSYDAGVRGAASAGARLQAATSGLRTISDLPGFRQMLNIRDADLGAREVQASSLPESHQRELLLAAVRAERTYLAELERLLSLSPKASKPAQLKHVSNLADKVDEALAAATTLHASARPVALVSLDPTALTRLITASHSSYLRHQARLAAANRARVRQLAAAQRFIAQADGIMSRYSSSRTDLSNWISDVNAYGVTFNEAYGQLSRQSQVRSQLRSELASLTAPAPLVPDQQGLLAVIDRAINAMNGAVQGISQYQTGSYDTYSYYDRTPGWQQFESESSAVTQQYADASAKYQSDRAALLSQLKHPLR